MIRFSAGFRLGLTAGLILVLTGVLTGCRLIQRAADLPGNAFRVVLPGKKKSEAIDLVELQSNLLRFSDDFASRMLGASEQLRRGTNAITRKEFLEWRITYAAEIWIVASGENALANMLDMVAVVTLTRMAVEDHWLPHLFGESAQPLLEICQQAETNIWQLAGPILTREFESELREILRDYHRQNPYPDLATFKRTSHFTDYSADPQQNQKDRSQSSSVFSLLMIDPLSGLTPASRELAQTRLFGERAMFIAQKAPYILRWHAELLSYQAIEIPEVQNMIANVDKLSLAMEKVGNLTETLPARLSQEREEIVKALQSEQEGLTQLASETRAALAAGSQMLSNASTVLIVFDRVVQDLSLKDKDSSKSNSTPFRIQDYTEAAEKLDSLAQGLQEVLAAFDQTLGSTNLAALQSRVDQTLQEAQSGGADLTDYVFKKALMLVLIGCGLVLVSALAYRWIRSRMAPLPHSKP